MAHVSTVHDSTFELAGSRIPRAGLGAARLTAGDGWGEPTDRAAAVTFVREAVERGIRYIDTADVLGPGVSESIIGEALRGNSSAVVASKAGMLRFGEHGWGVLGRPEYLKQQAYTSRLRLKVDSIDLFYLHRIDPQVPLHDQIGALQELRDEGVIRSIGVSEPTLEQLDQILLIEKDLAAVQSHFNVAQRWNTPVVERTAELGIPFIAYWPVAGRALDAASRERVFAVLAREGAAVGLSASQLALAWITSFSPLSAPIFGTRSIDHLSDNLEAVSVVLSDAQLTSIRIAVDEALGGPRLEPTFG